MKSYTNLLLEKGRSYFQNILANEYGFKLGYKLLCPYLGSCPLQQRQQQSWGQSWALGGLGFGTYLCGTSCSCWAEKNTVNSRTGGECKQAPAGSSNMHCAILSDH